MFCCVKLSLLCYWWLAEMDILLFCKLKTSVSNSVELTVRVLNLFSSTNIFLQNCLCWTYFVDWEKIIYFVLSWISQTGYSIPLLWEMTETQFPFISILLFCVWCKKVCKGLQYTLHFSFSFKTVRFVLNPLFFPEVILLVWLCMKEYSQNVNGNALFLSF